MTFTSGADDDKTVRGSTQYDVEGTYRPVKQLVTSRSNLQYDALGIKRTHPVRVPNGLRGSRPNAQPHARVSPATVDSHSDV